MVIQKKRYNIVLYLADVCNSYLPFERTAEGLVFFLQGEYKIHLDDKQVQNQVLDYFEKTVIPHKIAVFEAGMDLIKKLSIPEEMAFELRKNLVNHDFSKFSDQESIGYVYRNSPTWDKNDKRQKQAFDRAWLHHMNHNEHHPEYWLKRNREGKITAEEMPEIYVIEMIADWIGAGKTYKDSLPFEVWAKENFEGFLLHENTKKVALSYLRQLGVVL